MSKARSRQVDMLSAATQSAARSRFMLFTTPHIELPGVIIMRSGTGDISGLDELRGKRVGVVSSYVWQEWITRDYPDVKLHPVSDLQAGLLLLSFGQLDAMVGNLATVTHFIEQLGITNLRVAARTGYFARLALASRKDWPELNAILQKAVSSVTPEESRAIGNRWIHLEASSSLDARTILLIVLVVAAVAAGGLIWNYSLRAMVRRQNRSLRSSEARFRGIVEDQTEFIARSVPGTHALTFVNEAYCRCFGKTAEAFVGTSFMDHGPREDQAPTAARMAALSADNPVVLVEHRAVGSDGEVRWYRWYDRAIFDDTGTIVEIQSVGRDVTESKLAEDELHENEQRYRLLIEASPDAILVTREDGQIVFANSTAVELYCAGSVDRLIGTYMIDLVHPDYRDDVNARRERLGEGEILPLVERRRLRLDGTDFFSESRSMQFVWDGESAVFIVVRDITERKQAEDQLRQAQKMEAVGQLTGGIAHDFNNLLTVILINLRLLERRDGSDEESLKLTSTAISTARRGGDLTKRLLAFARDQPLEPVVLDLNGVVEETSKLLANTIGENITVDLAPADDLWMARVDPVQMQNALLNLAINAGHAMPDGGRLTIGTANVRIDKARALGVDDLAPGKYVSIWVEDDGTGMPPEVVARVFDPFFTTKEIGEGSGLGLSMVYGFAKQSGGGTRIESNPEHGTRVMLYLPRASAAVMAEN